MKILLVNTEPMITRVLSDYLSDIGHQVGGWMPLDRLLPRLAESAEPADLLIADLPPLGVCQLGVLREAHRRNPHLLIVLVAKDGRACLDAAEALACGVHGYLRMPISLSALELMLIRLGEGQGAKRTAAGNGKPDSGGLEPEGSGDRTRTRRRPERAMDGRDGTGSPGVGGGAPGAEEVRTTAPPARLIRRRPPAVGQGQKAES